MEAYKKARIMFVNAGEDFKTEMDLEEGLRFRHFLSNVSRRMNGKLPRNQRKYFKTKVVNNKLLIWRI